MVKKQTKRTQSVKRIKGAKGSQHRKAAAKRTKWLQRPSRRRRILLAGVAAVLVLAAVAGVRIHSYFSIPLSKGEYPVKGVDVSSYQGKVNWETLYKQDIAFAYIKASEGSSHVDSRFSANWKNVRKTNIRAGAYHFMSLETSGKAQAKNFLAQLTERRNMLPPVIDVEFYGKFTSSHPSQESLWGILDPLLKEVEDRCGMEPVIYTGTSIYKKYISGRYDNRIWIADETMRQPLSDGRQWTFCQYSFSGRLKGYSGGVKSIDLDVFQGDRRDFFNFQ